MSLAKICELTEVPEEGTGKTLSFEHPFTYIQYDLGIFRVKGRLHVITDRCKFCGGSLGRGELNGLYISCTKEEHAWSVKTGVCKHDRTNSMPIYKVQEQEDGIYINI